MNRTSLTALSAFILLATLGNANAGPFREMMMAKKAKEAASSSGTDSAKPATPATTAPAADKSDAKFSNAKLKCKELGNKEGSDKFNSCVMTLME